MKIPRTWLPVMLGLATAPCAMHPQGLRQEDTRFRLELSLVPHSGEIRQSVLKLVVKLTNTSADWISEDPCTAGGALYRLLVLHNGTPIEETQEARSRREAREDGEAKGGICNGHGGRRIKPGEHWEDVLYYDAAKSGVYDLSVERNDFKQDPPRSMVVKSNTVTVVVPEPEPERPESSQSTPKDPFTIRISTRSTVHLGEPILVRVILTNVSDKSAPMIAAPEGRAEFRFNIRVQAKDGRDVPETEYGRRIRLHEYMLPGNSGMAVEPGKSVEEHTQIDKLFDMSSPGTYEVELSRPILEEPKNGLLRSNRIFFRIQN